MDGADEVRNLLGRYCERIDAGDFDGVGELFADADLCAGDGPPFAAGAEAIATFFRSTVRLHDGSPRTKHLVTNVVVEEEPGALVARSSYLVLQQVGSGPLQPIVTGRYVDRFVPSGDPGGPDAWRFAERRFHVDLVGDLTHHLADPTIAQTPTEA